MNPLIQICLLIYVIFNEALRGPDRIYHDNHSEFKCRSHCRWLKWNRNQRDDCSRTSCDVVTALYPHSTSSSEV